MSFKHAFKPGRLGHHVAMFPQRVDILAHLATLQKQVCFAETLHNSLLHKSFLNDARE